MSIHEQLVALGFTSNPIGAGGDFELRDDSDGLGVYIIAWRSTQPCPFPELVRGPYGAPPAPFVGIAPFDLMNSRMVERRRITEREIEAGFLSSALGAPHFYPSKKIDQQNINANVVSSLLDDVTGEWVTLQICRDASGVWDYRAHTAAQIQHVGRAGKAHVMAALLHGAVADAALAAALSTSGDDDAKRAAIEAVNLEP